MKRTCLFALAAGLLYVAAAAQAQYPDDGRGCQQGDREVSELHL